MKKKIVVMFSLVLCMMLSISLVACKNNKHEAKSEWKFDNAQHWHECATKGHEDKLDVADHTWNEGVITTKPTEEEYGVKTYTCIICGANKTEPINKLTHTHTFDMDNWEKDDTNHWHKATCGHDDKLDEADHTWNEGVITTKPTEEEYGVKTYTCIICGANKTEPIDKLTHTHTFDMDNWEKDSTHHWHKATCGHDDKLDEADHTWNEGVITTKPTEEEYGVKTYTCIICGANKTEPINKLTHTHTFDMDNWEKDDTNHWHKATCSHTEEVKDKAAHTFCEWTEKTPASYGVDRVEERSCTICGEHQERTIENSALAPKDNAISVGTINFTYNAKSQPIDSLIEAGSKTGIAIKYVGVEETTYEESTTAPTNAGTYQYTITIPATTEWKAAEVSGKFTIAKYEFTVLYEKTNTTKEYDGSSMIEVAYKSLDGTDLIIIIFMKSKDVGTEISRISLPGLLKDNYTYDQSKVKAEIVAKKLSGLSFFVKENNIDKETDVFIIEEEIIGANNEKLIVRIEFRWVDLDNDDELELKTTLPAEGAGGCKISLKVTNANYEFYYNIGTLTLVRETA